MSVCWILLSSAVANVTKYNEEIDTSEVVLNNKHKALEATLEVTKDNPENSVRLGEDKA